MGRFLALVAVAVTLYGQAWAAQGAEPAWPAKPVHLFVPGGVGGILDLNARWLADRLAPALDTQFVVENKIGAGGDIGMQAAARSAPDGYTLVMIHQGTMSINPHLYAKPGYDPLADFTPVIPLTRSSLVLGVNADQPAQSVRELVELAKSRPGRLGFASPGIGTAAPYGRRNVSPGRRHRRAARASHRWRRGGYRRGRGPRRVLAREPGIAVAVPAGRQDAGAGCHRCRARCGAAPGPDDGRGRFRAVRSTTGGQDSECRPERQCRSSSAWLARSPRSSTVRPGATF